MDEQRILKIIRELTEKSKPGKAIGIDTVALSSKCGEMELMPILSSLEQKNVITIIASPSNSRRRTRSGSILLLN